MARSLRVLLGKMEDTMKCLLGATMTRLWVLGLLCVAGMAQAATISFTLSAADAQLVVQSFAAQYGYVATIPDPVWTPQPTPGVPNPTPQAQVANPETQAQFAQRHIREWVVQVVQAAQIQQVRATAAAIVAATPTPALQ